MKIYCKDCTRLDKELGKFCGFRKIFINPQKGRFCKDYIDKSKAVTNMPKVETIEEPKPTTKPVETLPDPTRPIEQNIIAPKQPEEIIAKEVKHSICNKILNTILNIFKRR